LFSPLETAAVAVVIVDQSGEIVLVNGRAEKLLGYSRPELLGQSIEMVVPSGQGERHARQLAAYFEGPYAREMGSGLDLWAQRKDGTQIPVEISLSPVMTRDGMFVAATIRDLADIVALARRMMDLMSELGDELGAFLGRRRAERGTSPLTPRELEILQLAAQGLTGRQISERLVVSRSTVKTHFANIYAKLGVSDRAAAVAQAIRQGLMR
jgi:PAS domain S-box-containing protein